MTVLRYAVRSGAYHDSIVLMQLQTALLDLPGVEDVGVVMATEANRAMLAAQGLLAPGEGSESDRGPSTSPPEAADGDLLVALRAASEAAATDALSRVDELLHRRRAETDDDQDLPRARSLRTAVDRAPDARWVLVSVPGRHAAEVAREALRRDRNVFLYSDNVSIEDEVELKRTAAGKGLLVLGPDCGTASIGGIGLGFANRVRRGSIGLVAASGTGLQAVASRVHALGQGISQAIGTGGRDLSDEVGAITARAALEHLAADDDTRVVVLISKPPSPAVASRLLARALRIGKPVVVAFLGQASPGRRLGSLHFARDLEEAAELAVALSESTLAESTLAESTLAESTLAERSADDPERDATRELGAQGTAASPSGGDRSSPEGAERQYVRGLFSGGTLALQALLGLRQVLHPVSSNLHVEGVRALADPHTSRGHTVVDLGDDELTVGRLHPMMDLDACRRRLEREAGDRSTALILLDVVLGDVAHPDPAGELAPVVRAVVERGGPPIVALLIGTDQDPQEAAAQVRTLEESGARVCRKMADALDAVLAHLSWAPAPERRAAPGVLARSADLAGPISAINVGLDVFHQSLVDQGATCSSVDWRPPTVGDERLRSILGRLKS